MSHRAFVSSTFKDLKAHRTLLIDLLRKSGITVDPMEDWSSDAQEPQVFSQQRVAGCSLCVLLVARRRGHVPDPSKEDPRSITQMEYDYARAHHIDVLPFFLDEDTKDWPAEFDERATDPLLKEWQDQLRASHGVGTFSTDPTTLVKVAAEAVARWKDRKHETANLHAYLRSVEEEFGVLRILSVPNYKDEDNRNIRIDRLYVEPAVGPHWLSPDRSPKDWNDPPGALEVFLQNRRLVLLGDPGSGKSTLVAWVAWQFAVDALPDGRHTSWPERLGRNILGPVIPLPFVLRLLNVDEHVTWDRLMQTFLAQPLGKPLHGVDLERYLKDGLALILLDGLDEVGSVKARQALRAAVFDGMFRYPKCRWLLTSRLVGYEEVPFDSGEVLVGRPEPDLTRDGLQEEGERLTESRGRIRTSPVPGFFPPAWSIFLFELCYLAPFDDPRVERFARNWYTLRENAEVRIQQGSADLVKAIRQDPGTQSLGRVPYLLTLMALIHRVDARLPNGRALLYNKIAEAHLQTIDDFRNLTERRETLPVKKRWLARVGYEMQCRRAKEKEPEEGAIVAGAKDVCQWVAQAMNPAKPAAALADAEVFVNYIARRTGLLLPRGEGQFGFVHLSFQEYFAACYLKQQVISPEFNTPRPENLQPASTESRGFLATLRRVLGFLPAKQEYSTELQKTLRTYANEPVWREVLIFLCELIANSDEAQWLRSVLTCMFGENLSLVTPNRREDKYRAVLLARLVADPQSGLLGEERTRAITACCCWEVAVQSRLSVVLAHEPLVAAALFSAHEEDLEDITQAFAAAFHKAGSNSLTLRNSQIADVGPLTNLTNLKSLRLGGTLVADVGPLAKLTNLEFLVLDGAPVADVGPLAKLTNLQYLDLSRTKVSEEEVARLREALPKCEIDWRPKVAGPPTS